MSYKLTDRDYLATICLMGMGMWIPPGVDLWRDGVGMLDVTDEEYQDRVRAARADWAYKQADALIARSEETDGR